MDDKHQREKTPVIIEKKNKLHWQYTAIFIRLTLSANRMDLEPV